MEKSKSQLTLPFSHKVLSKELTHHSTLKTKEQNYETPNSDKRDKS